jgi:hypothetical protein
MSRHYRPSKQTVDLIEKRLDLSLRFMQEVIADPSRLDEIPASGSTVVILPADDPEFAEHERGQAKRLAAHGHHVVVVTVGAEPITEEGWARLNAKLPRWNPVWAPDLDREQPTIVYDQERDALFIDLSGGERQGWGWPRNDLVYLLIDEETEEAFGYLIPEFVTKVVRRVPELAQALMLAEVRPLKVPEQGQLEILRSAHRHHRSSGETVRAAQVARDDVLTTLERLSGEPVAV